MSIFLYFSPEPSPRQVEGRKNADGGNDDDTVEIIGKSTHKLCRRAIRPNDFHCVSYVCIQWGVAFASWFLLGLGAYFTLV